MKKSLLLMSVVMLTLTGCQTVHSTAADEQVLTSNQEAIELLVAHPWKLVTLNQQPAAKGQGGKPIYMTFSTPEMRISGFAGCNNFFGQFSASDNKLTISQLAMTRKFCADSAALESQFGQLLPNTSFYQIQDGQLVLRDQENQVFASFTKG